MNTREEICKVCGERFLFRIYDSAEQMSGGDTFNPICPHCHASMRKQAEQVREQKEQELRRRKAEEEHKEFLKRLKAWNVVEIDDVCPLSDNVLYILGNGFDLMHRVASSYYNFQDSLGRHNRLRNMLEDYITVEDIWADFENALAHFDIDAMSNEDVVDMWLDNFDVYNEESGAAEYSMSVEVAATPIQTVANELPRRFRKWVETLSVGTADRPLSKMFRNGKAINFNYTEFVESLYGLPKENVCYIHGCRVKQKGKPREPLILGHLRGASDEAFEAGGRAKSRLRGYRRAFVEMAQGSVIDWISGCDEYLTKDTKKIIGAHEPFFSGLSRVETVIVVGHSFSETDSDYFLKIKSSIDDVGGVKWFFGCYGLRDIENLEELLNKLGIDRSCVAVFRTDTVVTTPLPESKKEVKKRVIIKPQCTSKDGKWTVEKVSNDLVISNSTDNIIDYSVTIPGGFKRAFFVSNDNCLLVVMYGLDPGVLLFRKENEHWKFAGELRCNHQHLLVSRLQHVFVTETEITFVYNNRIRKYSLTDSSEICNKPAIGARNKRYDGKDITRMFSRERI